MERILTCRKCHKTFVAKDEEKNITWVERSNNYNYHKECWDDFINMYNNKNAEEWFDLIFDLFTRDLHSDYDFFKVKAQAQKFVKEGRATMKGIYYSLYWYHIIEHHPYEKMYGIGIVPYIYDQSTQYWAERENKKAGIMQEILQLRDIEEHGVKKVIKHKNTVARKITAEPEI